MLQILLISAIYSNYRYVPCLLIIFFSLRCVSKSEQDNLDLMIFFHIAKETFHIRYSMLKVNVMSSFVKKYEIKNSNSVKDMKRYIQQLN